MQSKQRPPTCATDASATRSGARSAAATLAAATPALARSAHAAGSDLVRLALIGCGGRGTGAAVQALQNKATRNVKLVAMADAFSERLDNALRAIQARCPDQVDVPEERRFVDLNGYRKAIACDVDLVLICTPPGFRPQQFEAAVQAGRHVFMEKPLAVDAPGVRRILRANEEAKRRGLLVAVGHHLRHEIKHREVISRIHDGAIGRVKYMRAYFNSGGVWTRPRKPGQTEMQYQVNNWYYFTWLSGDHIVEQHVHDLDVMNWIKQDAHPVRANGMGGRQVRGSHADPQAKDHGEIFDHHSVEFEYEDGTRMYSFCRHILGCWNSFSEHARGTKGSAHIEGHGRGVLVVEGQPPQQWDRGPDGHQVEHDDLFAALMAGRPYNEVDWAAQSTMTAIMGRMATYSGKQLTWEQAFNSQLDLSPSAYTWDAQPPVLPGPDGRYACAMPGVTRAW
ncbi:MAG TPA: Gfo/Idh/MocA family oxidoreductase [Planctomycetaceae bacterium]|nr:Gfo/Idh/MocA family oxidoreductase [Planctomycetaceae bacterium]